MKNIYLPVCFQKDETRDHIEVCLEGGAVVEELSQRIANAGGCALIIDYGHEGTKTDTFRVFIFLEIFLSQFGIV